MGRISRSLKRTTSAKRKEKGKKMHLLALTACLLLVVKMSEGAVAVGVGRLNPENPSECLDPDTGLNHTLGVAWNIPGVCGQAHCELRNQQVYISYAFCGSAQAEAPCYLSSTDLSLPYPYCCPRSICPARLDVHTNLIDTDDYEDELQMAAATWDDASQVRVAPPQNFVAPPQTEGEENQDQENVILAYDTADDYSDSGLSDSSDDFTAIDDYPDVQIDWSAWISAMPSPVLID